MKDKGLQDLQDNSSFRGHHHLKKCLQGSHQQDLFLEVRLYHHQELQLQLNPKQFLAVHQGRFWKVTKQVNIHQQQQRALREFQQQLSNNLQEALWLLQRLPEQIKEVI